MKKHFSTVKFSAQDKFWEIYDEEELTSFIEAISSRLRLDYFSVEGYEKESGTVVFGEKIEHGSMQGVISVPDKLIRSIHIHFDQDRAKVRCDISPDQLEWFEHFMIDLTKCLNPATFGQVFRLVGDKLPYPYTIFLPQIPYSRILIKQKTPDPFVEGIKVNLISNLIWAVLGVMIGFFAAFSTGLIGQIFNYIQHIFK